MSKNLFGFLKSASVEEVVATPKAGGGVKKQRNPNPMELMLRVWKDGSTYPSQALVDKFNLEFPKATIEKTAAVAAVGTEGTEGYVAAKPARTKSTPIGDAGNGFDVIDSRVWPGYKADGNLIFIAAVKRGSAKIDLFGATTYDETGNPRSSVMDQGAATFGKEVLLNMLKEVYNVELNDEKPFVDLMITDELGGVNVTEVFSKPILNMPKRIVRGEARGANDYVRRENSKVFALVPVEMLNASEEESEIGSEDLVEQDLLEA